MLRIRLQRCQGLPRRRRSVPRDQGNTPGLTSDDVVKHQVSEITLAERNKETRSSWMRVRIRPTFTRLHHYASPIMLSTTVPLTGTVLKPILHEIGHCPTYQVGEGLSKRWGGMVCIVSYQA